MKKHAIIPIFIPHNGCPHTCVFCNQRVITARSGAPSEDAVRQTIDTWLTTLKEVPTVEIAFYGGSFTAIPLDMQRQYLAIAKEYKDAGLVQKIHLSTRPDALSPEILDMLSEFQVDVVELGVQSFDDDVLMRCERGHDASEIYRSFSNLKERGFSTGIQLMVGLPGDTWEKSLFSAEETARLKPDVARLYPTVVLPDTALYESASRGEYHPLSEEAMIQRTAAMYRIIAHAGIHIIRVGLKSNDLIGAYQDFHPAFRQLVEGHIAREDIEMQLQSYQKGIATAYSCGRSFSNMVGNGGRNRLYFKEAYPEISLKFKVDDSLEAGTYHVILGKKEK